MKIFLYFIYQLELKIENRFTQMEVKYTLPQTNLVLRMFSFLIIF